MIKKAPVFLCAAACLVSLMALGEEVPEDPLSLKREDWKRPQSFTVMTTGPGDDGIRLETSRRDWSQQITCLVEYPETPARLVFRGRMKTENVAGGGMPNEKARAQLVFLDAAGDRVGEWPEATDIGGTNDWTSFEQVHRPPPGTRYVKVMLGMYLSTGVAWYNQLFLTAYDKNGTKIPALPKRKYETTDTRGWWPFQTTPDNPSNPMVVDFSAFQHKPAGKYGFVQAKGGHFETGNGERLRFWGSGSCDFFPAKSKSDLEAERLARFGVNIVRLHGLDAFARADSIFDAKSDKTDRLDPDKLDRLDYYIAALKKNGIYIDLNLLTKRGFTEKDGVRDYDKLHEGGKAAAMFNRQLIELQKDYARLILNHQNPYTGLSYKDDPAIALVEIINESHLFDPNLYGGMPPSYDRELDLLFGEWCRKNGAAQPGGTVKELLSQKNSVVFAFLTELQNSYYREMTGFLREEIGVRVPICGSNQANDAADLLSNAGLDYIDRHVYWDHPSGGWEPTSAFTNKSQLKSRDTGENYIPYLARQHVAGKPFSVSEWNNVWPNEWIIEGPMLMAGYGAFHDWDALMVYGFLGRPFSSQMTACFEVDSKPHFLAAFVPAALLFLRGDVAPGPVLEKSLTAANAGQTAGLAFTIDETLHYRTLLTVGEGDPATAPAASPAPAKEEISWKDDRLVINTPRSQGYVGFGAGQRIETRDVVITPVTPFALIMVQSLSDAPVAASKHLLVTAVARAENTQQYYQLFKRGLLNPGRAPILMEPVAAKIVLKGRSEKAGPESTPEVYLVDANGRRTSQTLPVTLADANSYQLNLEGQNAFWFEVKIP